MSRGTWMKCDGHSISWRPAVFISDPCRRWNGFIARRKTRRLGPCARKRSRVWMSRVSRVVAIAALTVAAVRAEVQRVVILKVDGLPADLVQRNLDRLPWIRHVFGENGASVENFYSRGLSLSAPSWSMLDTGQ